MENKKTNIPQMEKGKKGYLSLVFTGVAFLFYLSLYFVNKEIFIKSISKFWDSLSMILPFLFVVFIIMVLTILFLKPNNVKKYFGKESGIKGILLISLAGILSVGSAYIWYPLVAELKEKGMREKLITIFIYNRAIKLQLFPLMIAYFGIKFSLIVSLLIFLTSFLVGEIVEKFAVNKI